MNLTFDDVLILPKKHRNDYDESKANVTSKILDMSFKSPIISSPMDTITGINMCYAMSNCGAIGIHHRYIPKEQISSVLDKLSRNQPIAIGTISSAKSKYLIDALIERDHKFYVMDVAHGSSLKALRTMEFLSEKAPDAIRIGGNIVNESCALCLVECGAHGARVGVGNGASCSTRIMTGVGRPQLSAIEEIRNSVDEYGEYFVLISDGGVNNPGDVCKAFAAGADFVMSGKLFAGCFEAESDLYHKSYGNYVKYPYGYPNKAVEGLYKLYRGMASAESRSKYGASSDLPEGVSSYVPYNAKKAEDIVNELVGYLYQSMFYVGATSLQEFRQNAQLVQITSAGRKESETRI